MPLVGYTTPDTRLEINSSLELFTKGTPTAEVMGV